MTLEIFKKYMRAGLGRCYTELKSATDINAYKKTVLEGCMTSLSYDLQSEGTRAEYVFALTQLFGNDKYFVVPTAEKFLSVPTEDDASFAHMAELLSLFLKKGNVKAMEALLSRYEELLSVLADKRNFDTYDYDRDCLERLAIILMSPSPTVFFKKIADDLGALFAANPHYSREDFDFFVAEAEAVTGKSLTELILECDSKNIKSFMKSRAQEKEPAQAVRKEASEPRDIFDLVLSDKEPSFAHKRKLIRDASREDWQRLNMMGEMLFSTSLKARVISLYSAAEKEYHNPPALIEYAEGDDAELSRAALEALAYCRGERICDYAAERLIRCRTDVYAIKMLINNTDVTEGDILGLALTECKYDAWDTDTYHEICERIITASEKNPKISRESLLFAYESTPCSRCRLDALRELIRRKMANKEILTECLFDSDEDIRELARENL